MNSFREIKLMWLEGKISAEECQKRLTDIGQPFTNGQYQTALSYDKKR